MTKVIGVISIKGGVGKTSTVISLGASLAKDFNQRVLIVDANFSAPNLGHHLGLIEPEKTIQDVISDKADIKDVIHEHEESGLHIIPAAMIARKVQDPFALKKKLNSIKKYYDYILIDSSPALNEEIVSAMTASDELFVVTTPDHPTLSCTLKAIKVAQQKNVPITGIILNKVRNKTYELSVDEIEKAAGIPVIASIKEHHYAVEAVAHQSPITTFREKSPISIEYKKLAAAMTGQHYMDPRFHARVVDSFRKTQPKEVINRHVLYYS
ncbi:MAG: MinD/ParA family protein [Candidatus Nanoarchaeia archaeon]|nr:MinD/ParA family protein [Candidatus Nanoarchaeia archaeon]